MLPDDGDAGGRRKKLLAVWAWLTDENQHHFCKGCKMTNAQADCSTCESALPELLPGNKQAFKLWNLCKRQWRVGANGPVGLDWPAILSIADLWRIKMTPEIFRKFSIIENHEISKAVELNGQ